MKRVITYTLGAIALAGGISWLGVERASQGSHEGSLSPNGSHGIAEETVATTSPNTHSKQSDNNSPCQLLEKQLQQLQQRLQTQQQALRQRENHIAQLTHTLAAGKPSDTEDPENGNATMQSEEEREQMRFEQLEGEFAQQKNDPEWSQEATTQIADTAEKVLYVLYEPESIATDGTSLVDANCRATLCRIELAADNLVALNSFTQHFPLQLGWQGSMNQTIAHEPDGSVRSIMYVSRDGHELPAEHGG